MLRSCLVFAVVASVFSSATVAQKRRGDRSRFRPDRNEVYKTAGDVKLEAHLYLPPGHKPGDLRPAIVFYFGGGWRGGSPSQFAPHAAYLASRGMVAVTVDYRVHSRHKAQVVDCVADAKSAMRWIRSHAEKLGVDPEKVVASGGSAGGHLAAAVAMLPDFDEPGEDKSVSCVPNALALFNPALDLRPVAFNRPADSPRQVELTNRFGSTAEKLSPATHVKAGLPPTIVFHGEADTTVPFAQAESFAKAMKKSGNRCEVDGYEGQAHGFFNYGRNENKPFRATLTKLDEFLASLGYLKGKPRVEEFLNKQKTDE
jgi:acetyl esterase/lipase